MAIVDKRPASEIVAVREVELDGVHSVWGFFPKGMKLSGYGSKIHTKYQVQYKGSKKWYKVYCCTHSNSSVYYTTATWGVGSRIE